MSPMSTARFEGEISAVVLSVKFEREKQMKQVQGSSN